MPTPQPSTERHGGPDRGGSDVHGPDDRGPDGASTGENSLDVHGPEDRGPDGHSADGTAEPAASARPVARWSSPAETGDFRRAVGRFATGICVVTTVADGLDHAMTVNAFTSVSLDPLLVLVCVETEARFCDAVLTSGFWAVSVLDASARPAADWLATRGRPLHGQFDTIPHARGPATGAPVLLAASAWLECRTHAVHPGGDHLIVVGEVVSVGLGRDDTGALLYHRSAYRKLD